jgi:hypothetical protein
MLETPADSFFDVFVEISLPGVGITERNALFTQDPLRMEATINRLPPLTSAAFEGSTGYIGRGWVPSSEAGNPEATPNEESNLILYYNVGGQPQACAELISHPTHTPGKTIPYINK